MALFILFGSSKAQAFDFSLLVGYGSKKIVAENEAGGSGTFLSEPSFNQMGVMLGHQSSKNWNFFFQFKNKSYAFNDQDMFLDQINEVTLREGEFGVDWIPFRYSKFSLALKQNEEIFLEVESGLAVLETEKLTLLQLGWSQYLYISGNIGLGLLVDYSPGVSGDDISNRTSLVYGSFFSFRTKGWGALTLSYHSAKVQKSFDNLQLEEANKTTELKWTL
ncbi:MAG: hypothetical protein CME62_15875 [Halobacteriovoraceae bacterium]|nr:hypothetical protein [Halobacteriovoraceae bacterium]